jgi:hypothetical protein
MRHPGHDVNDRCVMHYSLEGHGVGFWVQQGEPPTQFDGDCIRDLRHAGGR